MVLRPAIQIEGAREFRRALRRTDDDVKADLKDLHRAGALMVEREAVRLVPVRTGRLQGTIRAATTQTAGVVKAGFARVPYAGVIHFGNPHRGLEPQPFLYDAIDARREDVLDAYHDTVDRTARRHGLDVDRRGI